jgi:hypothetical protein
VLKPFSVSLCNVVVHMTTSNMYLGWGTHELPKKNLTVKPTARPRHRWYDMGTQYIAIYWKEVKWSDWTTEWRASVMTVMNLWPPQQKGVSLVGTSLDPVAILQEAGCAPGPVWTGRKSRPHRDSIPDRPARSQSLYRLSYPAHIFPNINLYKSR